MNETGVLIGWPKDEPGNGRMPKEFVVLLRIYPGAEFEPKPLSRFIEQVEKSGRYRKVFFVPFDLEENL